MDRREFIKLSSFIGAGLVISQLPFGDNMGYFRMNYPISQIFYTDDNDKLCDRVIVSDTRIDFDFQSFIKRNWDADKSIFVYDVQKSSENNVRYFIRAAVVDIPHKRIKDKMEFDRNFIATYNIKRV
jgi:hypothetical protein